MSYKNYTSEPVIINGETIAPFNGRKTLKPKDGVTYILPMNMWVKVRHRNDVVSFYKGELHGVRGPSGD